MAQSGYTPILIYASGSTGNTPSASNLTSSASGAELALNYFDGKLFYKDASGNVQVLASKAGNINVSSISFGTTGLTPNTATTGAVTVAGTLITSNGGTGLSSYTAGDLPYYASGTALSKLGIGTNGQILTSSGSAPQWSTLSGVAVTTFSAGTTGLTPSSATSGAVTLGGTLATTNGGTGLTSFTANQVFYASSTSAFAQSTNLQFSGTDLTVYGITVGRGAGAVSTNTAVGASALAANTSGSSTSAFGASALASNTSGTQNTGLGYYALQGNTTGSANTGVGYGAGYQTTTGSSNTSVGQYALQANTTASYNTAVGYQAGYSNTTGTDLVAVGSAALYSNTTGAGNSAFGYNALYANTTGAGNTAIGTQQTGVSNAPLRANTTGSSNIAVGTGALANNTTASGQTAVGYQAAYSVTTAGGITAIGYQALYANTSGSLNVAVGVSALGSNTTGSYGVAVGYQALLNNTTGDRNTAVGEATLYSNTTGNYNVAMGFNALISSTTASNNTAVGYQALYNNTTGSPNTAVGRQSGYSVTTGTDNVFLGNQAGYGSSPTTTGSANIYIGSATGGSSATNNYEIAIGFNINGKGSSTGFINPNSGGVYQGNNSSSWSTTSDQRLKKNIVDNTVGLDAINQVRIRNFEYRLPNEVDPALKPTDAVNITGTQLGVIAQELQQVLPDCVKQESTGVLSVDTSNITWHLINAIKELSAELNLLKTKVGA